MGKYQAQKQKIENILEFSDEVIAMIFVYVPDHRSLSLACSRFHEISCGYKFLTFNSDTLNNRAFNLNVMSSNRRFRSLKVKGWQHRDVGSKRLQIERLTKFTERFGSDVKKLYLQDFDLPRQIFSILNLMPQLEDVSLRDVTKTDNRADVNGYTLQLKRLKKLEILNCNEVVINVFETLLHNVLQKVRIVSVERFSDLPAKLFESQHKIEEVEMNASLANKMDFSKMKLTVLSVTDGRLKKLPEIIKSQHQMKQLKVFSLKKGELKILCNQLHLLEELSVQSFDGVESGEFSEIAKLKKLKTCGFWFDPDVFDSEKLNQSLILMSNDSLLDLTLDCSKLSPSSAALQQLGLNLPQMNIFHVFSHSSFKALNTIFKFASSTFQTWMI